MSEGFTCRGCGNLFFQAPKCVACGAQKLYDSTVKLQGKEIEAQAARIAELEAALRFYADKNSWVNSVSLGHPQIDGMTSLVELDKGSKALAALGGVKQ